MTVLEQINNQEIDNQITIAELRKAIEPGGFLDNNDNIQAVGQLLNNTETLDETDKELVNSLKTTIDSEINTILERGTVTEEDIKLINVRKELLGENDDRVQRLEELITAQNSEANQEITEESSQITEGPTKEEIIMQKYDNLELDEYLKLNEIGIGSDIITNVDELLEDGYNKLFVTKLGNDKITEAEKQHNSEKIKKEIAALNILYKLIKHDTERHEKLKNKIDENIHNMSEIVNRRIAGNARGNRVDYYKENERRLIQLWANINYGENLTIDGIRGNTRNIEHTNQGVTNLYIYKLEFETRQDVIDARDWDLLNIPNIDKKLEGLSEVSKKNIMREYLKFFFDIVNDGPYFENLIGDKNLEDVFDCLVNAEAFKNMSMELFTLNIKNAYAMEYYSKKGVFDEEYENGLAEIENKLNEFNSPRDYYLAVAKGKMDEIKIVAKSNRDYNHYLYMMNIRKDINELIELCNEREGETQAEADARRRKRQELYDKIILSEDFDKLSDDEKRSIKLIMNSDYTNAEINGNNPTGINSCIARTYTQDPSKRVVDREKKRVQIDNQRHEDITNNQRNYLKRIKDGTLTFQGNWRLTYILEKENESNVNRNIYDDKTIHICIASEEGDEIVYRDIDTFYTSNLYPNALLRIPKSELEKFNRYQQLNLNGAINEITENNNERYSALEEEIDMLSQYRALKNDKKFEIKGNTLITRDEYKENFPYEAQLRTTDNYRNVEFGTHLDVPTNIFKIKTPCGGEVLTKIEESQLAEIQEKLATNRYIINNEWFNKNFKDNDVFNMERIGGNVLTLDDLLEYEELENGDVVFKNLNGEEIRRINKETQNEITSIQNERMSLLNKPEVNRLHNLRINGDKGSLTGLQGDIEDLVEKFDNVEISRGGIFENAREAISTGFGCFGSGNYRETVTGTFDEKDLQKLRSSVIQIRDLGNKVKSQKEDWTNLKKMLEKIKSGSNNGISNEMEIYIDGLYSSVCSMLEFVDGGYLDDLQGLLNSYRYYEINNAWDIIRGRLKRNGIIILAAIGFAVAAILAIPTDGATLSAMPYLTTLITAAAGSLGGMVGQRVGTVITEGLNNIHKQVVIVNGQQHVISYDCPTDVELYLTGKMTGPDFWKGLGKEFAIGTAYTFGFMVAGQWVGRALSARCPRIASKIRPKAFKGNTEYTDKMFNNIINQGEREGFITKFAAEFFDECKEEFGEQSMDALGDATGLPILGGLASLYHSLTPGPNINVLQNNHVSFDMGHKGGGIIEGANINMTVYYEANINGEINEQGIPKDLIKYYTDEKLGNGKYTYHPETMTLTKENSDLKMKDGQHRINVIHLQPTNASLEARGIVASQLGQIGGLTVNHETGENFYDPTFKDLLVFKARELGLGQVKIDENGTLTLTTKDNITLEFAPKTAEYFGNQSHRFMVSEVQARMNSNFMDYISETGNLQEMKTRIEEQYKTITGQEINLSTEQLQKIIETHNMQGELGNLTPQELNAKRRNLSNVITDGAVVRFLFEAGFCGTSNVNIKPIQDLKINDIQNIINGKGSIKIETLNINDLRLLMRKSGNIGLNQDLINKLATQINTLIDNNSSIDPNGELKAYVEYVRCTAEIKSIKINKTDPKAITEQKLNKLIEIQGQINQNFEGNEIMINELTIEINRKKFEAYDSMGNKGQAKIILNETESLCTKLQNNDINNFKYRRCLLETSILKIQLTGEATAQTIDGLNNQAQEIRDKTEAIGSRTDTETLISKIESGILLGKTTQELQPYLDFLVLAENGLGISILGSTIETISNTFKRAENILKEYSDSLTDSGEKTKCQPLVDAGGMAIKVVNEYQKMKDNLNNDPNGVYKNEIKQRLENYVKNKPVSSITDFGNDFSHPTILLNPNSTKSSPVMSIEVGEVDYRAAETILQRTGINMDGNRESYEQLIQDFNLKVDKRIRDTFKTENLQELNSPEHRALFDYIAAKFMEGRRGDQNASLSNLSEIMGINGLQDCRLHAFTKQLFFDTRKKAQLQSLNFELTKEGLESTAIESINKKIKIIENTKMTFIDASFSGNVDMNNMYVARTQDGYMIQGNQNNVIEEHTFNLIEIPVLDGNGNIEYEDVPVLDENGNKKLDSDNNIITERRIKTKICFADSFYQGITGIDGVDTGKVYNLSYNGDDISTQILGKKGGEISINTTIIGENGQTITITIKPLGRSIQGRGGNLEGQSTETRGPDLTEIEELNKEYRDNEIKADEIRYNREAIQGRLKEQLNKLRQGEATDLTDAMQIGDHKVVEWQEKLLKRAFELYSRPEINKTKAANAIEVMISNTITQNAIDFAGQNNNATEFLQTETVFFENMEIFNEIYRAEIDNLRRNLDPNDQSSIQRLKDSMKNYQEIISSDMNEFFERTTKTMIEDGKWNEEYHRNNFEKAAKRFKSDIEEYIKVCETLKEKGLYDESFDLREDIKDQYKKLLANGQELLGHLINFDGIKSELKGPQGREIYAKLLSIQTRINNGETIDFDKEFGKDSNKFRELLGLKGIDENGNEFDKGWSQITIIEAINKIQESGLSNYYEIIGLVYNPQIEQMLMEDAVYGSREKGYYYTQNEGYVRESHKSYEERMVQNEIFEEELNNGSKSMGDIEQHLRGLIETNEVLDETSKVQINDLIATMINEFGPMFPSSIDAYKFFKATTESLIFQTMESDTRSMGDHGINHIKGNIERLNNYLKMEFGKGNLTGELKNWQLMGYITNIFHDNGYAALISQGANHRSGSDLHPFTSKIYFDGIIRPLLNKIGINNELINGDLISQAIESHDGINLDFSSEANIFLSYVNLADNLALGLDKVPILWRHPKIINKIGLLYQWSKGGMNLEAGIQALKIELDNDNEISTAEREALKSAITELNRRSFENVDFLSIHPKGNCTITENGTRRINMYKATTFDIAAEICGIEPTKLNELITEARSTGDTTKLIEIISNEKFGNQIVKPLKDYQDKYILANESGQEYPKKKDKKGKYKYDMDIIAADLLIGKVVQVQEGVQAKENDTFVPSTGLTILEYAFNENGDIPQELQNGNSKEIETEMTGYREGIISLDQRRQVKTISDVSRSTETLLQAIKDKKVDITTEVNGLIEAKGFMQSGATIFNNDYAEAIIKIKEEITALEQNELKGPTYQYTEIETKLKKIKSEIDGLIRYII